MTQERRRFARWSVGAQAKLTLDGSDVAHTCHISDVSMKGIQVACACRLPIDAHVNLRITLSSEDVLTPEGWVAWHRNVGTATLYGIFFSRISDSDKERIFEYLKDNFPQEVARQWSGAAEETRGGEAMEDKRVFARVPAHLPLRFLEQGASTDDSGMTSDVSAKGVGFVAGRDISAGTELELWLKASEQAEPMYTRGQVAWSRKLGDREYRIGVNLERADLMGFSRLLRS